MDSCGGGGRDLSIGSTSRLRGRSGATLHTYFQWALRHQPQPDVCRLDPTLSRSCSYHAERVDGRITSGCGRTHPPGRSARRAYVGRGFRGRLHSLPEAGSSIPVMAGAESQDITSICRHFMQLAAAVLGKPATRPGTVDQRPGVFMRGVVVLLHGFQHLFGPPLPLDARCVGRLPDEDRGELLALYGS